MIKEGFRTFLENDPKIRSSRAISSRMSKAIRAEQILGMSLDEVVADDDVMYDALISLQAHEDPLHNPMQNAVRKYYIFKNNREFPQLKNYHRGIK